VSYTTATATVIVQPPAERALSPQYWTSTGLACSGLMSNPHVPIAVSSYGSPEDRDGSVVVNVYAQPVSSLPSTSSTHYTTAAAVGYAAAPSHSHSSISTPTPVSVQAQAVTPNILPPRSVLYQLPDGFQYDERIIRLTAMQRSLKCLAMLDLCLLILMSVFQIQWAFLLWGPAAGYMGTNRYNLRLIYVYVGYWCLRSLADAILAVMFGLWWFLISFLIDLYILRYVWRFCISLKAVPDDAIVALRNVTNEPIEENQRTVARTSL
jgi:hypothetical protein